MPLQRTVCRSRLAPCGPLCRPTSCPTPLTPGLLPPPLLPPTLACSKLPCFDFMSCQPAEGPIFMELAQLERLETL